MCMPMEFQETITMSSISLANQIGATVRFPSRMSLPLTEAYSSQLLSGLESIRKSRIVSTLLSRSFADAIQSNAFFYTAYKEKMTGIGWMSLGTDWNTMQTYAGLSEEFSQPVMDGMVVKWIR